VNTVALPLLRAYYVLFDSHKNTVLLTLLLTLCGLTSQKTHRGGLGLSGLVHEEAHLSFPYSA